MDIKTHNHKQTIGDVFKRRACRQDAKRSDAEDWQEKTLACDMRKIQGN